MYFLAIFFFLLKLQNLLFIIGVEVIYRSRHDVSFGVVNFEFSQTQFS